MNHEQLTTKLEEILRDDPRTLKAEVAQEALDQEDIPCFFRDLACAIWHRAAASAAWLAA